MKVILNKCFGGFDVSDEAYHLYAKKKGVKLYRYQVETDGYHKTDKVDGYGSYFTKDFGDKVADGKDFDWDYCLYLDEGHREDPVLVEVVEELGDKASGFYGKLKVVEIPDGLNYVIDDYDGIETLHEDVPIW